MLDIGSSELLLIIIVAIVVIGPKDLPRALYKVGQVVGKARGMARHFRSGVDNMIRESELADMEKKWQADNERIMREHPMQPEPEGQEDWPAQEVGLLGEPWPEPEDAPARPAPRAAARANDKRPKPPPRRSRAGLASGSAPPIPTSAKDEGA